MSNLANIIQTSNENRTSDSVLSGKYNVRKEEDKFFNQSQQDIGSEDEDTEASEDEDEMQEYEISTKKSKIINIFNKFNFHKKIKQKSLKTKSNEYEIDNETNTILNRNKQPEANDLNNQSHLEQEAMLSQSSVQNLDSRSSNKQELKQAHFQTKIRNSGFWGKVNIRKGTWFVIIGIVLISIGLTVVSIFWRWWYGPAVNIPCRTVGITFLSLGFFAFLFGLISNYMMVKDPLSKHFIGSPPRAASWVLLASIIGLTIASDLITIYYTHWHNRFVNNPMIAISIVLFFFSPIAFVWSVLRNFSEMKQMRIKFDSEFARKIEEKKQKKYEKNKNKIQEIEEKNLDETFNDVINTEEDFQIHDETNSLKQGFRKKNLKLKPRTNRPMFLNQPQ